jgi:hypothetical protein
MSSKERPETADVAPVVAVGTRDGEPAWEAARQISGGGVSGPGSPALTLSGETRLPARRAAGVKTAGEPTGSGAAIPTAGAESGG